MFFLERIVNMDKTKSGISSSFYKQGPYSLRFYLFEKFSHRLSLLDTRYFFSFMLILIFILTFIRIP